jgi:hypothetical protein
LLEARKWEGETTAADLRITAAIREGAPIILGALEEDSLLPASFFDK